MGIIPRKLKKINGFFKWKFGILVYETEDDRIFLIEIGKTFDNAVKEGRIIIEPGKLPTWDGVNKKEMEVHRIIMAHYLKNINEINDIVGERVKKGFS